MNKICLVTNYNYQKFLPACLDSALSQDEAFDKIIVIDDGSTDQSRAVIESYASQSDRIVPVFKVNAGQLSCFNSVRDLIDDNDLVALLDADDVYPTDYLRQLLLRCNRWRADFYFSDVTEFESDSESAVASCLIPGRDDVEITCSSALTRMCASWVGSPTSAIALTGRLYRQIFPYPRERDWVTRADDVLIFGSSLLGARKVYFPGMVVGYRVHGNNHFYRRPHSNRDEIIRKLRIERVVGYYSYLQSISPNPRIGQALDELLLIPGALRRRFQMPERAWKVLLMRQRMGFKNVQRLLRDVFKTSDQTADGSV